MGNGEVSGTLHIEVESRNIHAGDVLTGMIYLYVEKPVPASELVLYFKGKEKTRWSVRVKERNPLTGNQHYVTYTRTGHHNITKVRFPVFIFTGGMLQPGQYSFPFAIRTPSGVPNSFSFKPTSGFFDSEGASAVISYRLVAKVEGEQANIKKSSSKINITRPVTQIPAAMSGTTNARLSTWCCLSKGAVKVSVDFDKNMFIPGETATITIDVNNEDSQLAGSGLIATLTRVIRLRDDSDRAHTITTQVNKVTLGEAIAPGKSQMAVTKKTLQLTIPKDEMTENAGSVDGKIIDCEYFLAGEVDMDGCCMCCGDAPKVSKVMTVYPSAMGALPVPQPPPNWNPQVMERQEFVVEYSGPAPSAPPA